MGYTNPKAPRVMVAKTQTPGSGGGIARQSSIQASPLRANPYTGGKNVKNPKGKTVAAYTSNKAGNDGMKKGSHKMANGGERGCDGGVSRASKGRQRL